MSRRPNYLLAILLLPSFAAAQASNPEHDRVFTLGEIRVIVSPGDSASGVGGTLLRQAELRTFERVRLDDAVNLAPGVSSTFDANGRRNESDIFVRGFGRLQVPLMIDGVRVYLPADNRLDFARFLTGDLAAIQIRKGYASVIDGPGAMGGAINLVTGRPVRPLEAEASFALEGRAGREGWNGHARVGTRAERLYAQGSVTLAERDRWSLSGRYDPAEGSLQGSGARLGSDTRDVGLNAKVGYTPNPTDEYAVNLVRQTGSKGAPLNVHQNPPVPPNSFWRWPRWDVQSLSLLTRTRLGTATEIRTRWHHNTFRNVLDAFDDATYSSQDNPGRFRSPYDDTAYGASFELGRAFGEGAWVRAAAHLRRDLHTEQQHSRPTHPTDSFVEPLQEQVLETWSVALEGTVRPTARLRLVGGVSRDDYQVTKAEEYNPTLGLHEYPRGGANAWNAQAALLWDAGIHGQLHASVSDRARFPTIFELYSTRFGTATPNPDLGAERAANLEVGWERSSSRGRVELSFFRSEVRDLIQTVVLQDGTTQTQNVGRGRFQGLDVAGALAPSPGWSAGGHYTLVRRRIRDDLQPELRATGVPTHRAFLHLAWSPRSDLTITPSVEASGDRWSSVNPPGDTPYIRTGAHTLVHVSMELRPSEVLGVSVGARNLLDEHYELAWGYPQQGRSFHARVTVSF